MAVILFDGECGLCRSSVGWIVKRDRRRVFQFAARGSRAGRELISRLVDASAETPPESMVLIDGERTWYKSDAVIEISRRLGFPWSVSVVWYAVPRVVRDWAYGVVSGNRRRIMGGSGCGVMRGPRMLE